MQILRGLLIILAGIFVFAIVGGTLHPNLANEQLILIWACLASGCGLGIHFTTQKIKKDKLQEENYKKSEFGERILLNTVKLKTNTSKEPKAILLDLKNAGVLSEIEFLGKLELLKEQTSAQNTKETSTQIARIVEKQIRPFIIKLNKLLAVNLISQEEYNIKKNELLLKHITEYHENKLKLDEELRRTMKLSAMVAGSYMDDPLYVVLQRMNETSILNKISGREKLIKYRIRFKDGREGDIWCSYKHKTYFIHVNSIDYHYKTKEQCISELYKYLTTIQ